MGVIKNYKIHSNGIVVSDADSWARVRFQKKTNSLSCIVSMRHESTENIHGAESFLERLVVGDSRMPPPEIFSQNIGVEWSQNIRSSA
ncbi:hypothetical protein TNCV_3808571 [Trichonephila clavipes]|nr:hypothetical protein TNCV_3808571 [Trichonephila clavipes]